MSPPCIATRDALTDCTHMEHAQSITLFRMLNLTFAAISRPSLTFLAVLYVFLILHCFHTH